MKWRVGLVTIALLGCSDPAQPSEDPYCGNGHPDPGEECDTPGLGDCSESCTILPQSVTAHWQFVTLAGDPSDCLPGAPSVEISTRTLMGSYSVGFSAPCEGGQAMGRLPRYGIFDVMVTSMLDHAYATTVPFTLSPTGDLPLAVILSDAGDVRVGVTGLSGYPLNCGPDPYGLSSVAVRIDDGAPSESTCAQAVQTTFSRVSAGPHQLFATGYDTMHAMVASAGPVNFTALGGTAVNVTIAIARP